MGAGRVLTRAIGGVGVAAAGALSTGFLVERRVVRTRRATADRTAEFFGLSASPRAVLADDGVALHAEIDELAPYEGKQRTPHPGVTLVFAHGYALSLHSWFFQREAFRGKYRMAFYDQRSHGRSERGDRKRSTIDQLGDDMAAVLEQLVPEGKVILVGHSMGGMSIMAFAERHPEVFAERVAGVALLATCAGNLRPHRILSRLIPDTLGSFAAPRLVAALAAAPELVDSARTGSNIGFLVAKRFAFATPQPNAEIEFLDQLLAHTPMDTIGEFFPTFTALDKFAALARLDSVPALIVGGVQDRVTTIGHSRRMARAMPDAELVECDPAGHMVTFEARDEVNAAIERLVERAG